ncbi:hypothetical protein MFLAVUS_003415 [Mucor flavus]|uniref:Methyltransferase-like protein 4 n=1 Tax=Mucor flavus TaxID=439312 RepID=A0ABP9YT26_9FUNG
MLDIIDSEKCFSRDIEPYTLIEGEFDVCEPYFRPKKESTEPPKKRKKTVPKAPSVADVETQKRHEEIRPNLALCLEQIESIWPESWKQIKSPRTINGVEAETIDFPSIQTMVEMARGKFGQNDDDDDEDSAEYNLSATVITDLDMFSIFNLICINAESTLKLLQITPACQYIIPPKSSFLMGSIADSLSQLGNYVNRKGGADLIVMDPPWPNKSVSRSSHYETQDIYDLYSIPISQMMASKDCIVAIWVTNKPKFRNFILNKLFPAWGLVCVSEWAWLKVTTQAECIFPLDSMHKKPYEQLILGRPKAITQLGTVPMHHTIVSIPSIRHSRKPPLEDVLKPYLTDTSDPIQVELFARCLTPGWISWGNECLKFQHLNYFDKKTE